MVDREIIFSGHAEEKLVLLTARKFPVSKEKILDCLNNPDRIDQGYKGRKIAQKGLDAEHVLRVVFAETDKGARIITLYPGRRSRYENKL